MVARVACPEVGYVVGEDPEKEREEEFATVQLQKREG